MAHSHSVKLAFIIPHCATQPQHNTALQHCIQSIQSNYADVAIHIIDDNSSLSMRDVIEHFPENSIHVHGNPWPGSGEVGAMRWYLENKVSDIACFMHDSMMVLKPIDFEKATDESSIGITMLWYFDRYHHMHYSETQRLISLMKPSCHDMIYREFSIGPFKSWHGCFGVSCIAKHEALLKMQDAYGVFDLVTGIREREHRQAFERILGILICIMTTGRSGYEPWKHSICGNIFDHPKFWDPQLGTLSYEEKMGMQESYDKPFLKTWFGR